MNNRAVTTVNAPAAIGPYSQAVAAEGLSINVSGQLPIDPATGEFAGDDTERIYIGHSRGLYILTEKFGGHIVTRTRRIFENYEILAV